MDVGQIYVKVIFAHSPQAKGRIERAFGTLQDRLICEMRLQHISTIEEANNFLPSFIEKYNAKFGKAPGNPFNTHRPLNNTVPLKYILCFKHKRTVSKNLEISFENEIYQLQPNGAQSLKKAEVDIIVTLEGEMRIEYQGQGIKFKRYDELSPMKQNIVVQEHPKKLKIIPLYGRWNNRDLFRTVEERGYRERDDILTQEEEKEATLNLKFRRREESKENIEIGSFFNRGTLSPYPP